ncbi:MAG: exo-alpha-sialidase [Planctomycetaceae bacterium]|nr:exo-alpha-sialidase [Planctomycetaceae bacterium]
MKDCSSRIAIWLIGLLALVRPGAADDERFSAELIFPLNAQHNHAPGIAELADGSLFVTWYRGSGERRADDVVVLGARRPAGQSEWSAEFPIADTPGFPDCNTCLMVDDRGRLWVFWPIIIANTWESCLTRFQVADNPVGTGAPAWNRSDVMFLKPADFGERGRQELDAVLARLPEQPTGQLKRAIDEARIKLGDKLYQRLGWQPRCKPTTLPSGRILLPLYSDTFSIGLMAISDDEGATWHASEPLLGFGAIQPSVVRRDDGTLVAYMRENGPLNKIRVSESKDDGETWGPVGTIDLPNPGSGLDAVRLKSGAWALVYNDLQNGRNQLAVSLSDDEGKTWPTTRHLERHETGSYHYPAIIQAKDGTIHVAYSYFVEGGKSMKHAEFNEAWIRAGE